MKFSTRQEGEMLRIVAEMDFVNTATGLTIKKGELGGLIKPENCLSQHGSCWISEGSKVTESFISEDAYIEKSVLYSSHIGECSYVKNSQITNADIKNSYIEDTQILDGTTSRYMTSGATEICNSILKHTTVDNASLIIDSFFNYTNIEVGRRYKDVVCSRTILRECEYEEGTFFTETFVGQGYEGDEDSGCLNIRNVKFENESVIQNSVGTDTWRGIHETKTNGELAVFTLPLFVVGGREIKCPNFEYGLGVYNDKVYVEVRGGGKTLFFETGEHEDIGFLGIDNSTFSEISMWDIFENTIATGLTAEMFVFGKTLAIMATKTAIMNSIQTDMISECINMICEKKPMEDDFIDEVNDAISLLSVEVAVDNRDVVSLNQMNLPKSIIPIIGSFEMVTVSSPNLEMAESLASDIDELKEKFRLFPEREYTEAEKSLIPEIPSYIKLDALTLEIANLVKKSFARPAHLRKTNLLFEGPKGTGKTQRVTTLAGLWGVPRVSLCCSSNMTEDTLVGGILPYLPETTLNEQLDTAVSFYETKEGMERPEFVFVASQLALALEHGWVCEIQEPTCINDAGVLIALNSILEKDGQLQLPNRIIKRHPEAIVIITTNRDYEGCRPLNQALRDRMDWSVAAELPKEDDLVERVMSYTGCTEEALVRKAIQAVEVLNEQLVIMGINNSVSQRGLNNFIADLMDGIPVDSCIDGCLLNSITTDPEELAELKTTLVNSTNIYNL